METSLAPPVYPLTPRVPPLERRTVYQASRKLIKRSPREDACLDRKLNKILHEKRLAKQKWQQMTPRTRARHRQRAKQEKIMQKQQARAARLLKSQEKKAAQVFAQETRRQARALGTIRKKKEKKLVSLYELLNALQKATPNRQRAVTGSTTVGSYLKKFKLHSKRVVQLIK